MNSIEYVANVKRTEPSTEDYEKVIERIDLRTIRLLHAAMGLCTEAAEFLDMLKKSMFYGRPLDEVNAREEIGDTAWYQGIAVDELETQFEAIWERNIAKLKARFGEKFSQESAINRNLEKERRILEDNDFNPDADFEPRAAVRDV